MDWISSIVTSAVFAVIVGSILNYRLTQLAKQQEYRFIELDKRREASKSVVDILSKWVQNEYKGKDNEYLWELQTIYWKNILLLDPKLLEMLIPRLENAPNAPTADEIIIQARKILLDLEKPDVSKLNHWLPIKAPEQQNNGNQEDK